MPKLSSYIKSCKPSALRAASIYYAARLDGVKAVNVAIGNVPLPMHPALVERLKRVGEPGTPFAEGRVMYTSTVGLDETRDAFRNILRAGRLRVDDLYIQITEGGSHAMESAVLACCGPAGSSEDPLLLIDAAYTNYRSVAQRLGRPIVSFCRTLSEEGEFEFPDFQEIEDLIVKTHPSALLIIPYDNPTGHLYTREQMLALARLCVKYDMWLISDEAYRELYYTEELPDKCSPLSIWSLSDKDVHGIEGRRLSIETASKVWNACGLRIGALVTDNLEMHNQMVAESTMVLCPSAIGQWIFGALAEQTCSELRQWFAHQRAYYRPMLKRFQHDCVELMPDIIVSHPAAALYQVVDVRRMVGSDFDCTDFVTWCAKYGAVPMDTNSYTLLTAPMTEFYDAEHAECGRTQMRIAYVQPLEVMAKVPYLLKELLKQYDRRRK